MSYNMKMTNESSRRQFKMFTLLLLVLVAVRAAPRHFQSRILQRAVIDTDDDLGSSMPKEHHNYEEMLSYIDNLIREYPKITHKYSIGRSVEGRELWVIVISDEPDKHEAGEPEFKYVANMHGNEVVGRELLLHLAKVLCQQYGKSKRLTKLVDDTRMHFLISMNPDGYEAACKDGGDDWLIGRNNANNKDLNRNFPDQFFPRDQTKREPEVNHTINWIKSHPFILSANLHGGSLVANYPYDDNPSGQNEYTACPDDDVFKKLALTYSFAHKTMHLEDPPWECKGVPPDHFKYGVTNGANWYNVAGGMQDYNYLHSDCMEITLELGCNKFPKKEDLPRYWEENKKSLVEFIEQVHQGIKGSVKDQSGNPIEGARIHIDDRAHVSHSHKNGDYWRILYPGSYIIKAVKSGYKPITKTVEVGSGTTTLDFQMENGGLPDAEAELESPIESPEALVTSHDSRSILEQQIQQDASTKENAYPLLSQIQQIDQQLMLAASQPDMEAFNAPTVSLGGTHDGHNKGSEDFSIDASFDPKADQEFFMNNAQKDQPTELDLEKEDFFDHKNSEFTSDEA